MAGNTPTDWRFHPIYFVGIGVVMGLAGYESWLLPARLGAYHYEVAGARDIVSKANDEARKQADRALAAERRVAELEKQVRASERSVFDAMSANTFIAGSPYPIGMGMLKLGDPSEKIEKEIPNDRIDKRKLYWSIKFPGHFFDNAVVYWEERASGRVVSQVLFFLHADARNDPDFLRQKLVHALGTPSEPGTGTLEWYLSDGTGVFLEWSDTDLLRGKAYKIRRAQQRRDTTSPPPTGSIKR